MSANVVPLWRFDNLAGKGTVLYVARTRNSLSFYVFFWGKTTRWNDGADLTKNIPKYLAAL